MSIRTLYISICLGILLSGCGSEEPTFVGNWAIGSKGLVKINEVDGELAASLYGQTMGGTTYEKEYLVKRVNNALLELTAHDALLRRAVTQEAYLDSRDPKNTLIMTDMFSALRRITEDEAKHRMSILGL